jgi:hypothetical protein
VVNARRTRTSAGRMHRARASSCRFPQRRLRAVDLVKRTAGALEALE